MAVQWYESEDGRRRLSLEMAAIETFNRPRPEALRLVGRRHKQGHLIVTFAFQPLATRRDVVRGELMLSSQHPLREPAARILSPELPIGPHLISGEGLRNGVLDRSIPLDWAREGPALCMFDHTVPNGPHRWLPSMTVVSAVLNVQSWWLNYLHWTATGQWPFDRAA